MSTGTGSDELNVIACNACESEIRLPSNVKSTAKVKCPLCSKVFRISDVTGPPVAEIVQDDDEESNSAVEAMVPHVDRVVIDTGEQDSKLDRIVPAPSYEKTTARGRAREQGLAIEEEPNKTVARRPRSSKKKTFVRKKNKKVEFIKLLLGMVMALPVAQLVLWWGFKKDPFDIAPRIAEYAPLVVPTDLRPQAENDIRDKKDPDAPNYMRVIEDVKKERNMPRRDAPLQPDSMIINLPSGDDN